MAKKKRAKKDVGPNDQAAAPPLPPGVKLLRTLEGHQDSVKSVAFVPQGEMLASGSRDDKVKLWEARSGELLRTLDGHQRSADCVAFDPQGATLASGSRDNTVKLWEAHSGTLLRTLEGHRGTVYSVAFDPQGATLASGSWDKTVKFWEARSGKPLCTLEGHQGWVHSVAFDPQGGMLASGSGDYMVKLWEACSGKLLRTLEGHQGWVSSVAFDWQGGRLASGSADNTVRLWDARSDKLLRTLEGHTGNVDIVAFSPDGHLLASKSRDQTIRLWSCETWETVAVIPEPTRTKGWTPALTFHPALPLLAAAGSEPGTPEGERSQLIHLWELDFDVLLGGRGAPRRDASVEVSTQHRTAKVILVGDTGVGKSGLAHRLIHNEFKETHSSHARRASVLESDTVKTPAGVEENRETVLWDLAGQPAYRLVHQLAMDDAAVACVLFDARSETNPLEGAAYWSQALDQARTNAPITRLLVPARTDVGGLPVSRDRIEGFARENGFAHVFPTSAFTGEGCAELLNAVREQIRWDELPAVSSTETLTALRELVAKLKREDAGVPPLLTVADLHQRFEDDYGKPVPLDTFIAFLQRLEDTDAVDVLAFHSVGQAPTPETRVLLDPTRVDAYASALLVAAKDEPDGPGHLLDSRVREGDFRLPNSERLGDKKAEEHLLWYVLEDLFERDLALRETIKGKDYVVFPAQCTSELKFPGKAAFGVAYGFAGPVRGIYATLIAQLAHYDGFSKRQFYQDAAAYRADRGGRCLVRLRDHGNGTAELEVSFEPDAPEPVRRGFLEFVARHLESRSKPDSVTRRHAHHCSNTKCRNPFEDRVVKLRLEARKRTLLCPVCELETPLLDLLAAPTEADKSVARDIEQDARAGRRRTIGHWVVEAKKTAGKFDVFLSYNSKDRTEVKKIAEELKEVGLRPWVDYDCLVPGQSWIPALEEVIEDIPCAAAFVGADGLGPWKKVEIQGMLIQMVRRKAGVMPVLLPGAPDETKLPAFLNTVTWADMRDWQTDKSEGLERLVSGILGKPLGELRMLGR